MGPGAGLTQPVVEVVLQVPVPQLHRLQDDISVTCEEVSVKVGGHRHQVKLLHAPDLQARLLSCLEELGVFHHHAAGLEETGQSLSRGRGPSGEREPGARGRVVSSTKSITLEPLTLPTPEAALTPSASKPLPCALWTREHTEQSAGSGIRPRPSFSPTQLSGDQEAKVLPLFFPS